MDKKQNNIKCLDCGKTVASTFCFNCGKELCKKCYIRNDCVCNMCANLRVSGVV